MTKGDELNADVQQNTTVEKNMKLMIPRTTLTLHTIASRKTGNCIYWNGRRHSRDVFSPVRSWHPSQTYLSEYMSAGFTCRDGVCTYESLLLRSRRVERSQSGTFVVNRERMQQLTSRCKSHILSSADHPLLYFCTHSRLPPSWSAWRAASSATQKWTLHCVPLALLGRVIDWCALTRAHAEI